METVSFTRMQDGTREDYALLGQIEVRERTRLPGRVLTALQALSTQESGYRIDRFQHCLQTATRALRDDADEETVVCALVHDIGDLLAPDNHSEFAAALLRPYVSERNWWIIRHHGLFQGYYYFHHLDMDRNARDRYRDHAWYDDCVAFCERWDQTSFDPDYDTLPLETFVPMVERVFSRPPRDFV